MFIAYNNDLITEVADTEEELLQKLQFRVYTSIEETEETYVLYNGVYMTEEQATTERQKDFENNFLATPLGNYRLQPKGYANAQQSIDTVNALATMLGGLNETLCSMVIFYATPDFSKPEECTEEWLVQHQSHPQPMTLQEWATFYITFSTRYAQKMYKKDENEISVPDNEIQE